MKEKNFKRKFLAATLGTLIVVNILSLCDFSVVKLGDSSANLNSTEITLSLDELNEETETSMRQTITNAFDNFETSIPMTDFNVSTSVTLDLINNIIAENPQYFYISPVSCAASYAPGPYKESGIKYNTKLSINYSEDIDTIKQKIDTINQAASEITAGIDDSMTDLEKALYVHDYLALNYSYDERIFNSDSSIKNQTIFDLYNFFVQKTGVCQAYTIAYKYIMQNVLGIPTRIATSWDMGHAWNVIQIDGNWYHVDVTWDDPMPDRLGGVEHSYFLLSDAAMGAVDENGNAGHYNWNYVRGQETTCDDAQYDDAWFRNYSGEVYRIDGEWFSIGDDGAFVSRDVSTGNVVSSSTISFSVERDKWYAWNSETVFWLGNYTTLIKSGNVFFYNTTENVYVVNADGSNKRLVANLPKSEHNGFRIYNIAIDENNMLYAILQNNPQETEDGQGNKVPVEKEIVNIANISDIDSIAVPVEDDENADRIDVSTTETVITEFENWNEISEALDEKGTVEISLQEDAASLPAEVVESAKGKDVELIINVGTFQWSVNGLEVSDSTVSDVKLGVKENEGIIPEDITNKYVDDQQTVEVNLEHEGQFGYTANLKVYVGTEYAGKTASILHYDTDNNRLDYQNNCIVDEKGYAILNLQHASSYMVVIDDKPVGLHGDVNCDGTASLTDYVQFKQYLVGQSIDASSMKLVNADMDGDNRVTIRDAVLLARELVK